MKIGIDARLWSETGVGRYIRNLVKQLSIIDHKNEYVLFMHSNDVGNLQFPLRFRPDQSGLRSGRVVSNFPLGLPRSPREAGFAQGEKFQIKQVDIHWHSIKEQLLFQQIINKENLDLMHFPYYSMPILYNKPFVITIHDLIIYHHPTGKASTLPLPLYNLKYFGYKYVVKQAVKKANSVIVPLQSVKEDVVKTLYVDPKKVYVTPEGFDSNIKPKTKSNLNNNYFLYVGNAYPHKNLEMLINAFSIFKQSYDKNNTELILVGKEDYFYKKLAVKIKGQNSVKFLYNLSDQRLADYYSNALAVIAPSLMEGFGLVPLEAMANNCLVIASDIAAHKEVCKDKVIYFNPSDTKALVEKLNFVENLDVKKRKMMIEKGQEIVKNYSWEKMTKETLKIYENSLSI